MTRPLISDAHEWNNEIRTVPTGAYGHTLISGSTCVEAPFFYRSCGTKWDISVLRGTFPRLNQNSEIRKSRIFEYTRVIFARMILNAASYFGCALKSSIIFIRRAT